MLARRAYSLAEVLPPHTVSEVQHSDDGRLHDAGGEAYRQVVARSTKRTKRRKRSHSLIKALCNTPSDVGSQVITGAAMLGLSFGTTSAA